MSMKTNRASRKGLSDGYSILSPKQYEVAVWFGRGCSPKEIAARLGISIGKVAQRLEECVKALRVEGRRGLREKMEPDWDHIDGDDQ